MQPFFLAVGLWRVLAYHQTDSHHLGLEAGILYWHFVDDDLLLGFIRNIKYFFSLSYILLIYLLVYYD